MKLTIQFISITVFILMFSNNCFSQSKRKIKLRLTQLENTILIMQDQIEKDSISFLTTNREIDKLKAFDQILLDSIESLNNKILKMNKAAELSKNNNTFVTKDFNGSTKLFSGQSNNNTSNNTSSTSQKSDNPFGTGGDGGGQGSGSGRKYGNDQCTGGSGPGGNGNGHGRIRLNDPKVDQIKTNVNVFIYLKLTVNAEGNVVSAYSTSKTTTTDQRIINQVMAAVKSQVKYNKDPGSGLVTVFLTVRINAT